MSREELLKHLTSKAADVEDRYQEWAEHRARCPFEKVEATDPILSTGASRYDASTAGDVYIAWRHDDVAHVMRDSDHFMKPGPPWRKTKTLLSMNGPEHLQYRALLETALAPRAMAQVERDVIAPVMNRLIDGFAGRGSAELIAEFTSHFPFHVIRTMIGFPESDHEEFISLAYPGHGGLNAEWEVRVATFLRPRLEAARNDPQEDFLGYLVRAEVDGHPLNDEEIYQYLLLLIPAGADTTFAGTSNMFAGLLLHPDQFDLVRHDDGLVPRAVDEAIRWNNPAAASFLRRATSDTELAGTVLPAGTTVSAHLSAHNRDAAKYADPDTFCVTRDRPPRGIFGYGPHACLGMHLARAEMRTALRLAIRRLRNLRLDPDQPRPIVRADLGFPSPAALHVLFEPEQRD